MWQRLWWNKRVALAMLLALPAVSIVAQYRTHHSGVESGVDLSLGGGIAMSNTHWPASAPTIADLVGNEVRIAVGYELSKDWFVFGFGVGVDYDYTRQRIDSMTDLFDRLDREGDAITYAYRYSDYTDNQQRLLVSIPVYIGAHIGEYVYLLAGAEATLPIIAHHKTQTTLQTTGTYKRFIHTIENAPTYGYYAPTEYSKQGDYQDSHCYIAPMAEIGANFRLNKTVSMRVGIYAAYHFPLGVWDRTALIDYSRVDINPQTQTEADLRENIMFHAVPTAANDQKRSEYWTIGVKWTCRFVFPKRTSVCRCLEM